MIGNNVFAAKAKEAATKTLTENGATAYSTTDSSLVDLFSAIGALRSRTGIINPDNLARLERLIDGACAENPDILAKMIFYARDVRGGLGERQIFRDAAEYCAVNHPEIVRANLELIPEYGRWDDLFTFINTPLEDEMWAFVKRTIEADKEAVAAGKGTTLLPKWLPSADTSSKATRALGCYAAKKLGMRVYDYKRMVKALRRGMIITETQMSSNKWGEIKYPGVPSQAMAKYSNAFGRHDSDRFGAYIGDVKEGKQKINASTLYPYEIIEKLMRSYGEDEKGVCEELWKHLPNYVEGENNYLIMADTSGSMRGRPINTAIGLAIYFAERNKGPFSDMFMTFSSQPAFIGIPRNASLWEKITTVANGPWQQSTNLEAAFRLILETAKKANARPEDIPKSLIIISDMEFDQCTYASNPVQPQMVTKQLVDPLSGLRYTVQVPAYNQSYSSYKQLDDTFFQTMEKMFADAGYRMPNIVFWNVDSRHDTVHVKKDTPAVQLVSGQSPSVFRSMTQCLTMTPYEAMMRILDVPRYAAVRAA